MTARVLSCDYPQQCKQSLTACLRPQQLCNPTISNSMAKLTEKRSSPPSASLAEKTDVPGEVSHAWGSALWHSLASSMQRSLSHCKGLLFRENAWQPQKVFPLHLME